MVSLEEFPMTSDRRVVCAVVVRRFDVNGRVEYKLMTMWPGTQFFFRDDAPKGRKAGRGNLNCRVGL